MITSTSPFIRLDSFDSRYPASWCFAGLLETLVATTPDEVAPALQAAEEATAAGHYAVGFIAYEAAAALNPELPVMPPLAGLPLVWFAIFADRREVAAGAGLPEPLAAAPELRPQITAEAYCSDVERIRTLIAAGESYQVNYTFPLAGEFSGDPLELYSSVCLSQRAQFSALIDTGKEVIISASPEHFFSLKDGVITTRPMKGTAPRGRWLAEDRQLARELLASCKERAENLMIVDLLRNDLGRIAITGSVKVDSLFDIETYPTVQQMTSTISARVRDDVTFTDILSALFPCGSITGAPKRRSMAIIGELEQRSRGVYCGAIGCLAPGGEALFSVAIRTLLLERASGRLSMGVGSGITYDSRAEAEYAESIGKAAFVTARQEDFSLFETLRLAADGYRRLERHLARLADSAAFFGFPFNPDEAARLLKELVPTSGEPLRVKLELTPAGRLSVTSNLITAEASPLVVGIASTRLDPANRLLYHKTSCRQLYEAEKERRPDCNELLFLNIHGELAEGSYNNIILRIGGKLLTPPLQSGLLPGVMRGELLEKGEVEEKKLFLPDLFAADEILLVNSLRGIRRAVIAEGEKL